MTQLLDKPAEQQFIQTGVSWENFKAIQRGFTDLPGVRLFYFEGELEILSTSPEHEIVKGNIGYLVEDYMLNLGIEFVATGSFSHEKEAVASVQSDESYCFGERKPIPDLAIEVVITSGGLNKLKRYSALGVKEVWFWEDGVICMHYLNGNLYPRTRYQGQVKPENLVFNANLQEFAQKVSYITAFETRGKLSPQEAYEQIKNLWHQLKYSKKGLGISTNDDCNIDS